MDFWAFVNHDGLSTTAISAILQDEWPNYPKEARPSAERHLRAVHPLAREILEDLIQERVWQPYIELLEEWLQFILRPIWNPERGPSLGSEMRIIPPEMWSPSVAEWATFRNDDGPRVEFREKDWEDEPSPPKSPIPVPTEGAFFSASSVRVAGEDRIARNLQVDEFGDVEFDWIPHLVEETVWTLRKLLREGALIRHCSTPSCQRFFQAWRKDQKFCSELCGRRERARRKSRETRKVTSSKR